jgi:hypothetical protein
MKVEHEFNLEDIVEILSESLTPFLTERDKANLMSASHILDNYYFIPIDLYKINLSYEDFVTYFGNRPEVNLIGLNITFTQIDNDLAPLLPFLPRLQRLFLANRSDTNFDINFLSECKQLKNLELNISGTSLESLPNCVKLETLIVHTGELAGTGLSPLINCSNLKVLFLYNIEIMLNNGQSAFNALSSLRNLEHLLISEVSSFTSIPSLQYCSHLENIVIKDCENLVNISGVEGCTSLTYYKMVNCPLVTDFEPLSSCISLTYLFLQSGVEEGEIYPEIKTNLFYEMANLEQLVIHEYKLHYNSSLQYWSSLRELALFYIQGDLQIPPLPDIKPNYSGLALLELVGSELTEIRELKMCEELKIIIIQDCKNLTNVDFIAHCSKLVEIEISNCPIISFEFLRYCLNLKTVRITDTELKDLRVFEQHTKITELTLNNTEITTLEGLEKCSLLNKLKLDGCIYMQNFNTLSLFRRLWFLSLKGTNIKSLKPVENLRIIVLDLSGCSIGLAGLRKMPRLKHLFLDNWPAIYLTPLFQLKNIKVIVVRETLIKDEEEDLALLDLSKSTLKSVIISNTEAYINRRGRLVRKQGNYPRS